VTWQVKKLHYIYILCNRDVYLWFSYTLEVCPITKCHIRSIEFLVAGILLKIFKTTSQDVVENCELYFGLPTVTELITKKKCIFT